MIYAGRWRDCCNSGEYEAHEAGCYVVRDAEDERIAEIVRQVIREELHRPSVAERFDRLRKRAWVGR